MYSFDTLASCVLQEEDERIKEFFHLLRKCWALRAPSPNSTCLKISRIFGPDSSLTQFTIITHKWANPALAVGAALTSPSVATGPRARSSYGPLKDPLQTPLEAKIGVNRAKIGVKGGS